MRLNIKNPNTSLLMYEKKSNKASIIIAVVAIGLVLLGVYLISESISSSKNKNDSKTAQSSSVKSEAKSSTVSSTITTASTNNNNSTTTTTATDSNSATEEDVTTSSTTSSQASSPAPAETVTTLAEDEAIIKVTKVTSGSSATRYDIEIVDTGFKDGTKLKKGATTYVNVSGVTLTEGKSYKITSITEKDGRIAINNLKAVEA